MHPTYSRPRPTNMSMPMNMNMAPSWLPAPRSRRMPMSEASVHAAPVVVYERVLSTPNEAHAPLPTHRKRLNSERCKAFRAKKKKHEEALVLTVEQLHKTIGELEIQHAVAQERMLQRRNSVNGSLVRVARQLKLFLQHNGLDAATHMVPPPSPKELEMVRCSMVPNAFGNTGDIIRVRHCLSTFYSRVTIKIQYITVAGSEDTPIVVIHSIMNCQFTPKTLQGLFPHVPLDSDVARRLIGKMVPYQSTSHFEFNEEGRVVSYDADIDFIHGLYAVLGDLDLVSEVARPPEEQQCDHVVQDPNAMSLEDLKEQATRASHHAEITEMKTEMDCDCGSTQRNIDLDRLRETAPVPRAIREHAAEPQKASMQFLLS